MFKRILIFLLFSLIIFSQTNSINTKKTLSNINIDGKIDESVWVLSESVDKLLFGTKNNTITFGTLWNDQYLYIAVKVNDQNLFKDSGGNEWDDDGVEFYVDADFNKGASYDSYDRQFRKVYHNSGVSEQFGNTAGVLHAVTIITGGYSIEMAIPWSNLNINGTAGTKIGFDIANNDDDNGGARESQIVWNGTADNWNNTSEFGELILSSETVGEETQKESTTRENVLIYFNAEDESSAESIADILQKRIEYFKDYDVDRIFEEDNKIFTFNYCSTLSEFNLLKPADTEDFHSSYIVNDAVYFMEPQTEAQLSYINNLETAALYGFARAFIRHEYSNQLLKEWLEYGFASVQAGLNPGSDYIKQQVNNLGYKPNINQLSDWDSDNGFDKYAFAYTAVEFIERRYSYTALKYRLIFNTNSANYGFRNISSESDFNKVWHYNLDLFYLNESNRMKLQFESENFIFYSTDADKDIAEDFTDLLEETYSRYSTNLEFYFNHKTKVCMYPTFRDYNYSIGDENADTTYVGGEGISIDQFVFISPKVAVQPLENIENLAMHEFAHIFHKNIKEQNGYRWVSEGFASFMPDGLMSEQDIDKITSRINEEFNKVISVEGRYPTIEDLNNIVYGYSEYGIDEYFVGQVIIDFIARTHGYTGLKEFMKYGGNDYSVLGYENQLEFQQAWYKYYDNTFLFHAKTADSKKILNQITVDGELNESAWSLPYKAQKTIEGTPNNQIDFETFWDDNYLYVAVKVLDASLVNDGGASYENDGVEVYIDADFNKGTTYDSYDRQFRKNYNDTGIEEINGNTNGVLHSVNTISGGYTVELAIPWSNLNITGSANTTIGFDVANNDDDNGGGRESIITWSGDGNNWQNTSLFGELTLSSETVELEGSVSLAKPDTGEVIFSGSNYNITWSSEFVDDISIDFSSDNGSSWSTITGSVSASAGSYEWSVPSIESEECVIKLTDLSDETVTDTSGQFTVTEQPSISISSPNGGEKWIEGTQQEISWNCTNISDLKIEYSTDNGNNWQLIENTINAELGSYSWTIPAVSSTDCLIKITAADDNNLFDISDNTFSIDFSTGVDDRLSGIPTEYKLYQNYPNPFNPTAKIRFSLPESQHVRLKVYDLSGKEVATIVNKNLPAGYHEYKFDASNLTSGVYIYQILTDKFVNSKKLILLK